MFQACSACLMEKHQMAAQTDDSHIISSHTDATFRNTYLDSNMG